MGRITLTEEQKRIAESIRSGQGASTQQAPSAYRGGRITLNQKQIQIASKYGLPNPDYGKNAQSTQTTVDDPLHKQYAAFMAYQNAVREAELAQIELGSALKGRASGEKKTESTGAGSTQLPTQTQYGSGKKGRFGFKSGKSLTEERKTGGKVSEQEYSRSAAMQARYGSYQNYLRGVLTGYDEAHELHKQRKSAEQAAENERKKNRQDAQARAATRIANLGIQSTLEQYYNAEGEEQKRLRQELERKGVSGAELAEWRNTAFNETGKFIGDLGTAFFQGGLLQNMSGMEGAMAGVENAANAAAAWALNDLTNPLPDGKVKTGVRRFAGQLAGAESRHEENAKILQEQSAQVMQQATQGHSPAAKWVIEQMPSAGNMLLNVGTAGMAGVPNLAALGTTAGGNAYIEAKNDGATDEQALAYGVVNGSLEVLSEKLFGGNPLYDTDAGLVNKLVAKLTDNKTIMRILNSKGFDLLSEGLEEVVTEVTEPWAQAIIYAGKDADFATWESVANAFAGGVFLSVVGNLADLPASMRNREVQNAINDVTERVLYQAEQVDDAGVQQAVFDVREKMEYGENATVEDLGNVLNAMSEAEAEVDAETVEAETTQEREQAKAEANEKTFQIYKSAAETAQENQRLAEQYRQEQAQTQAQQSVQAVQQAQRAAQQQYDQDSLLAPIPGTENMGELDLEQYARQQTAGAEQELDEAAAQQEEQYLQEQARRAGYDETTAAYFLNGNTTGMPAEQYAQSFGQVYEQGRLGASEQRAMRYAEGMNQDVAAAAYRAGLAAGQEGVDNGSIKASDEGQIRQAGQRAEGQAGGVRQSTAQRQRADAGRKRAESARNLAKAWDEVALSELGFGEGNAQTVRVMPKGQEAGSQDIKDAAKFFRSMRVQNVRFFTGQLAQEIDGQTFYADAAVTKDGSVLIRADSEEYSAFELAKHEGYHLLVKRWPEMAAKIQKRLLSEGKITKAMIESYVDAYAGIYGDDTDAYVEEIVADTYAGMNRTDYGTNKLRADVKVEVGQWQKKSGSARAPPAKMSASKAEKYDFTKPFAEQVDDWKAGKIGKNDTLVVGPTPEVFQKVGFNALPVTINQTHVDYALNGTKDEEHHIGEPMLKQLPRAMKSPVAIIASESQRGTSVVALLPFIKDAKTVIIPVYIDGFGRQNSVVIDSNAVTSIYEKKNAVTGLLTNAIKKSNNGETTLFYVDKVKAAALYQVARVPMPKMPDTDNGFVASIRDEGSTVKPKLKNVTQSQQFKRWFGDWQNHPESASKVVNADGTPKVVYHGTNAEFNTFQQENGAYFFSESRDYAESMADERGGNRIIESYLRMKNPYTVKLPPQQFTDNVAEAPFIRYAKEHGHDGVIFEYDGSKEDLAYDKFYVVFNSAQIKSATDNIGTFDKTNPDIRYSSASARQASERDKQNLETVSAMLDDGSGRGVFKDAVFLRNPRLMQKLIDEREKTQTAAFRDWFEGSKATNTTGEPLLVFHGAGAKFTKFDVGGKPIWLTANIKYAEEYSTATRSVERILPEASIYAGNVDRIIPAYIRVENPADVGNTDGGYSGNYVDLAKRLQIRPSELQAVWEQAGKPELMWQVINTPGMVEMLKRHGYDGVQAVENGVKAWAVFDSAQVKSAVANNGSFSLTNPDIRYSSQDGRYRDLMGEKAAQYTRRAENFLLAKIADRFGVSSKAKRETLQPFTEQIVGKFLQTGELDNKLVDDLVKTAAEISVEENRSYYEEYKGILKFIENQKISIPAQDKDDIRYWNQFRQQAEKSLQIRDDGLPVRDVYWTLHKKAPQLFPTSNKTAGAQIMQIYKVAEGIRKTREWIEGYKGADAAEVGKVKQDVFEARATNARLEWAKKETRKAIEAFTADLRVTQRYLDRQKKAKDLLGLAIPQSAGEALELSKEVKKLRGRVQYVMNKNLLTAEDQKIVGALLRGDISEEAVRKMKNSKGILDVYEAKAAYDARMLTLRAWRVQNKQRMLDEADADLDAAKFDQWVDKGSGWGYNTETPERNFADVMRKIPGGDMLAKEFNSKYIYKIKQNESARKNFILEIQERVKALDISEKVMKGNADSEAYAVQLLGEAQENAEMLKGQDAEEKKDGKTYEEWLAVIQKLKADNPNMDFEKIDKAITEFHKIYDELLDMINQVRVQFGYDPISYRRGYFPHFTENEESILARFGRELGFTGTVSPLPTTINGLTSRFRPGIRYFKNANERLGYATAYNAIKGLDLYLDTASDVIFHTEDVQRMRALETQIRYRASDEGIRRKMDAIKANDALDPDQKQQLMDELSKNGRTRMSHMAAWLTQYTNVLAGKRTDLDRKLEEIIPQRIYNFLRKSQQRVGANMVAANIGSAVTNFIPLTQAWAQTSSVNMLKGMWYTLQNYVQADGLDQQSVFINNRSGYHGLSQSNMDKASEIAGWVMEHIDGFTTGSIVRARVIENMQRGMSQQSALEEADQFASGIMADRSKGATPLMYTVRSPIVKMFTQFQLEVNNELSWIFKDMLPQERKKGALALTKAALKFLIGAWLYNEVAEAILGRRPALDPLDMLNDTVGDVSGYKVPNTWQAMAEYGVSPKKWDYTTEKKAPDEAWKGFASRIVDELPNTQLLAMTGLDESIGLDLSGNRIAVISAFPDMEKVNKALLSSDEDMAPKKKTQVLVDELSKPLSYAALPMGGGQARKSLQGIMSVVNGGKYSLNNEGEQQLQYPTYTDRPGDVPKRLAQGLLFGRTATQEAQDWIENGFKSLSVKETDAYQAITEGGEDQRKTYTFVQAIKNVEKEYDKKMLLKSYSISDTAKAAYFYQVFANEDQQKEMDKLDEKGKIDFVKEYLAEAEDNHNRDELRDAAIAGAVTQEKAIQRMVANDWAEDEDDAYWKYREWIRKADDKDYKMYDDFLNAIKTGGDVKEAAKEYLEHGKNPSNLSSQITTAYKDEYLAASPAERAKLKQKLLEIYAALGFDRKQKSKAIDEWVKDAEKEKKEK